MKLDKPFITLGKFNISKIKSLIPNINEDLWYKNTIRQDLYSIHNKTLSILYKWESNTNEEEDKSFIDYENINSELGKEIENILFNFILPLYPNCSPSKVMLSLLPKNSKIPPHIDGGPLQKFHRIHLPILTNDNCYFYIEGKPYNFLEGEGFEFDNTRYHRVENNGNVERIHLMIDLKKNIN